jgi:hypothetical protein
MGKTKTGSSHQAPGFASEVQPAVAQLGELFRTQGTQASPFYSDLARMFQSTVGSQQGFQLPDYITNTLQSAAETGLPSTTTPFQETGYYQALAPTFAQTIQDVLGATKEQFGAQGALRSSAYSEAAGKGVMSALSDKIMQAAQQAYSLEEAAKGRQMEGATQGLQAYLTPYTAATQAGQAATGIDASQYPLLAAMLSFAGLGAGQLGKSSQYQPNFGLDCCWTFIEGEGSITRCVREYRDKHFGKWSDVGLGYRWLSFKLMVPWMRRAKLFKKLVRLILTQPLTKYAEWDCGENSWGWAMKPLALLWISIWRLIGRYLTYMDSKIIATT